jgi:hypothetical protein
MSTGSDKIALIRIIRQAFPVLALPGSGGIPVRSEENDQQGPDVFQYS